jgi:hypothetical protein
MKNNLLKNIAFFFTLVFFIATPISLFAQSVSGTEVQLAPSYGFNGLPIGMESQISTGENQGFSTVTGNQSQILQNDGQGAAIGNSSQLTPDNTSGGTVVGTSANYSAGISAGLSCTLPTNPTFGKLIMYATCLLSKSIVPLLFGFAMVLFIWGVVQYVIGTDDEAKKKKGKMFMIWGIVALVVMTSVWGLVRILGNTFGVDTTVVPQLNTDASAYYIPIQTDYFV